MRDAVRTRKERVMENGISLYPGQGIPWDESTAIIEAAADSNLKRLFISLPEYECELGDIKGELSTILKAARQHNLEVTANITPHTMAKLGLQELSPSMFRMLGIKKLRMAEGFSPEDMASLSQNRQGIHIVLNASTATHKLLAALMEYKANFQQIEALHSFYPRRGTGLSEDFLLQKTLLLHKAGIRVGAFVPGRNRQHSLHLAGYATLENHRDENTSLAARHLVALGIDTVIMGNLPPLAEELSVLGSLSDQAVTIRAQWITENPVERRHLAHIFTSRQDVAQNAVRALEGHDLLTESNPGIIPQMPRSRPIGAITIDNDKNHPYTGEVQICRTPQEADEGVNVVAQIDEREVNLIEYISPGRKFAFILHE